MADCVIGACGVACSVCKYYLSGECPGCRELPCPIRLCAEKKGVKSCLTCKEFPCKLHTEGYDLDLSEITGEDRVVKYKVYSKIFQKLKSQ